MRPSFRSLQYHWPVSMEENSPGIPLSCITTQPQSDDCYYYEVSCAKICGNQGAITGTVTGHSPKQPALHLVMLVLLDLYKRGYLR